MMVNGSIVFNGAVFVLYHQFFRKLEESQPQPRVGVGTIIDIINNCHNGVGAVQVRYVEHVEGGLPGNFIWLEEERTSAYDEPYRDAIAFVSDLYREERHMRRLVAAKELMHVFDPEGARTSDPNAFYCLLSEIESQPLPEDASDPYKADRGALWRATLALVPPWIRDAYFEQWQRGEVRAQELASRLWLPEQVVSAAMGKYYPSMYQRLVAEPQQLEQEKNARSDANQG